MDADQRQKYNEIFWYFKKKKLRESCNSAARYIVEFPDDTAVKKIYADLLFLKGRYKLALTQYKLMEETSEILQKMVGCYSGLKWSNRAITTIQKLENRGVQREECLPLLIDAYALKKNDTHTVTLLEELIDKQPSKSAYQLLGMKYFTMNKYSKAKEVFEKGLQGNSSAIELSIGLSDALFKLGDYETATQTLESVLSQKSPHTGLIKRQLLLLAKASGDIPQYYKMTQKIKVSLLPKSYQFIVGLTQPKMYMGSEMIYEWRQLLLNNIQLAKNELIQDLEFQKERVPFFEVVYQGHNDKEIQIQLSDMYRQWVPQKSELMGNRLSQNKKDRRRGRGTKKRIIMVSEHFRDHSVMHFYQRFISDYLKTHELILVSIGRQKTDSISKQLKDRADDYVIVNSFEHAMSYMIQSSPDMVIYPEIGMSQIVYWLAHYRLAPHQMVLMGHPSTTGIKTIDYYISADIFESKNAQAHYSEQLIKIKGMPIAYTMPKRETDNPNIWNELIDGPHSHIYYCPMTTIKIHPDMDQAFKEILEKEANAVIALVDCGQLTQPLKKRFQHTVGSDANRIQFVSPLTRNEFYNAIHYADVILDSFPFGGGNTSLMSFAMNQPIVTLQGEFLRGRWSSGYYQLMGLSECVHNSISHYVAGAIELALNKTHRSALQNQIRSKKRRLFNQHAGCQEIDQFVDRLLIEN